MSSIKFEIATPSYINQHPHLIS